MKQSFIITAVVIGGLIVVLVLVIALSGGEDGQTDSAANSVDSSQRAPDFSLENYDGQTVALSKTDKEVVVVNLWASWCPFCTDELPDFAKLQETFPDRVRVIAINRGESLDTAKGFTDSANVTDRMTFLMDPLDIYYEKIGGFSMPETLFLGPERTIQIHKRGPMELEEMVRKVNEVLSN